MNTICRTISALAAVALMSLAAPASAQRVAVKNNLLYDAALTPNLGLEGRVAPKWTLGLNAGFSPFPTSDKARHKWRHVLVAPEARYWFCDVFAGHFVGVNAYYSHYNWAGIHAPFGLYSSLHHRRREGDAVAAGAFYGYSWILSPHWSLEAEVGIDVGRTWFDDYECRHCGEHYGRDKRTFASPKLGLNIIYNLK